MAVRSNNSLRGRRGTAIERWLLFTEQSCIEKRPNEPCDQTEVVCRNWGLGISLLSVEERGTSLKLGWAIPDECKTTSYEPGRSS